MIPPPVYAQPANVLRVKSMVYRELSRFPSMNRLLFNHGAKHRPRAPRFCRRVCSPNQLWRKDMMQSLHGEERLRARVRAVTSASHELYRLNGTLRVPCTVLSSSVTSVTYTSAASF